MTTQEIIDRFQLWVRMLQNPEAVTCEVTNLGFRKLVSLVGATFTFEGWDVDKEVTTKDYKMIIRFDDKVIKVGYPGQYYMRPGDQFKFSYTIAELI